MSNLRGVLDCVTHIYSVLLSHMLCSSTYNFVLPSFPSYGRDVHSRLLVEVFMVEANPVYM